MLKNKFRDCYHYVSDINYVKQLSVTVTIASRISFVFHGWYHYVPDLNYVKNKFRDCYHYSQI